MWKVQELVLYFPIFKDHFLSALEDKRINLIRKQGQFICNRCWKPKSYSQVRLVLYPHQLCLLAKILDMRVHSQWSISYFVLSVNLLPNAISKLLPSQLPQSPTSLYHILWYIQSILQLWVHGDVDALSNWWHQVISSGTMQGLTTGSFTAFC